MVASVLAAAFFVAVVGIDVFSGRVVLIVDERIVEPPWTTVVGGSVAVVLGAAGRLSLRAPGRLSRVELGLCAGLVGGVALASMAQTIPWIVVVMLLLAFPLVSVIPSWQGPVAILIVLVVVLVVRRRRARDEPEQPVGRHPALLAVAAGFMALSATCALLGSALLSAEDEVVVERGPGGCAVVMTENQFLFNGMLGIYRAVPGSPLAVIVESHPLERHFPLRQDTHAVTFRDGQAHVDLGVAADPVIIAACG
ncbi:hypothetical protein [Sanguibacter suaedae]|uniref:Uncharacterized protein n=1 Tax=Sanguibacter suaedae TaxID=2795737 RepID=A0A934M8C4_9MICO|nr:hypothetical protein [Sanguibacter suaedae]MBI9113425.1 hypothetical protein [Sanguibacter suaedae]